MKYFVGFVAFLSLTACNQEDIIKSLLGNPEEPVAGYYESNCRPGKVEHGNKNGSEKYRVTLNEDKTRSLNLDIYVSVTDCSGAADSTLSNEGTIEYSGVNLSDGVSFLKDTTSSENIEEYRPYKYDKDQGILYLGAAASELPANPGDAFAEFIASPESNADITLHLQP